MSNLVLDNDASSSFNSSTSLILAKPGPLSFDLSELLSAKTPYTPSSLSTYDSLSIKAEEDIFRPIISGESIASSKAFNELATPGQVPPKRVTLGDFVTKRPYNRRPKNADGVPEPKKEPVRRRKRVANIEKAANEVIVKKEKLQNGASNAVAVLDDDQPAFPEIVIKDGKIQVAESAIKAVEKAPRGLQMVQVAKKKITTSISFKQSNHTEKWTELENEKFYRALELFGTEFSMIARVFKNRDRNQIKNKFLREEKMFPEKVNTALKGSGGVNFHTLLQKFNKLRNSQQSITDSNTTAEKENCRPNLLMPLLKKEESDSNNTQETKESENNSDTMDNVDRSIMEDLSDVFLGQKNFLNI